MTDLSRRTLVKTSLAGLTLGGLAATSAAPASAAPSAIPLVRKRLTLPTGIATGDVTHRLRRPLVPRFRTRPNDRAAAGLFDAPHSRLTHPPPRLSP